MNKLGEKRMVDKLVEAYVSWRETCLRVEDAYDTWTTGPGRGATYEFGVYMAALDQEERAAESYAAAVGRAGQLVSYHVDGAGIHSRAGREHDQ